MSESRLIQNSTLKVLGRTHLLYFIRHGLISPSIILLSHTWRCSLPWEINKNQKMYQIKYMQFASS